MPGMFLQVLSVASVLVVWGSPCSAYCPQLTGSYQTCELYTELETALLADDRNLYRLHEEFFPSSRSPPVYGDVVYMMPCFIGNSSGTLPEASNDTLSTSYVYTEWSGSILTAYLSPQIIISFQLELLVAVLGIATTTTTNPTNLVQVEFDPELKFPRFESYYLSLILYLNKSENLRIECDRVRELYPVLLDLTSWLKSYARSQNSRSNWHPLDITQYKGYSYSGKEDIDDMFLYKIAYLLLAVDIIVLFLVAILMIKVAPMLYNITLKMSRRGNKWYSRAWATAAVATLINLIALALEFYRLVRIEEFFENPCRECSERIIGFREKFSGETKMADGIHLYKTLAVFILLGVDFVLALCLPKDSTLPIPRSYQYLSYILCCTYFMSHVRRSKMLQLLAIWNLLFFAHIVATSIMPVLLWITVLPAETISTVTLLFALTFCTIVFLSSIIKNVRNIYFMRMSIKDTCSLLLPPIILTLLMAAIFIVSFIYIRLISTRLETGGVGGFLVTFLPSVGLTVLGWVITKGNPVTFLLHRKWKESDLDESHEDLEAVFTESKIDPETPVAVQMEQTQFAHENGPLKEPLLTTT